jgi:hypothetical protein
VGLLLPPLTLLLLQEGQGRPHLFCDMRIVDDQGQQQPNDGKAVGHLQVGQSLSDMSAALSGTQLGVVHRQ